MLDHQARRACTVALAIVLAACAGTGDGTGEAAGELELSGCAPTDGPVTTVLVEASGPLPPVQDMEAALDDAPDAALDIPTDRTDEDVVVAAYARVVAYDLAGELEGTDGLQDVVAADPSRAAPARLVFSGPLPPGLAFDEDAVQPFGLEASADPDAVDPAMLDAAVAEAEALGMRTVAGGFDQDTGTARVEVIDATADQVAAWEGGVDGADRICLLRAARTADCDEPVELRDLDDAPVIAHEGEDTSPTPAEADEIRDSYLGLTVPDAMAKGRTEGRSVRTSIEDGVQLPLEMSLEPGRVNLATCRQLVVDATIEIG